MSCDIVAWFNEHEGEDDVTNSYRTSAFRVIPPINDSETILYCAKSEYIERICWKISQDFSVPIVGRYGLPSETDVIWLRSWLGDRPIYFIGDADPSDLLTYAWLRKRMPISYLGISDALLDQFGVPWGENLRVGLPTAVMSAMPLIEQELPDLAELIGERTYQFLLSGKMTDVVLLSTFATASPESMAKVLQPVN